MRDMAKIVRVKSTECIPNYDKIKLATFEDNAYTAIVPIDIYAGDLVCWIEADSLLPNIDRYDWLRKRCYVPSLDKLRIRVMKMAGHKSWGLVLKISELPPRMIGFKQGDDLTKFLGITKYEPLEDATPQKDKSILNWIYRNVKILRPIIRLIKKIQRKYSKVPYLDFPSYLIDKTDENSIQNTPSKLNWNADAEIYVTAKMEGQSATYFLNEGKLMCCSRNLMYPSYQDNNYCKYARDNQIETLLTWIAQNLHMNLIIQGELVGPGIQKNIYDFDRLHFYIFNMYDIDQKRYLSWYEMKDIVMKAELIGHPQLVPELYQYTGKKLKDVMPDISAAEKVARCQYWVSDGSSVQTFEIDDSAKLSSKKLWKDYYQHEGIVVRGLHQEFSFKVKNIDYAEWFSSSKQ